MNNVKIATIGPIAPKVETDAKPQEVFGFMIDFWHAKFRDILPDKPDIILVCETYDRVIYDKSSLEKREEYYYLYKNQSLDFFSRIQGNDKQYI